jgi:hypothetical protein
MSGGLNLDPLSSPELSGSGPQDLAMERNVSMPPNRPKPAPESLHDQPTPSNVIRPTSRCMILRAIRPINPRRRPNPAGDPPPEMPGEPPSASGSRRRANSLRAGFLTSAASRRFSRLVLMEPLQQERQGQVDRRCDVGPRNPRDRGYLLDRRGANGDDGAATGGAAFQVVR